jgi:hypothetical protein
MGHEMERVLMFFFLLICKETFRKIQIIYRRFKALSTISSRLLLIYERMGQIKTLFTMATSIGSGLVSRERHFGSFIVIRPFLIVYRDQTVTVR